MVAFTSPRRLNHVAYVTRDTPATIAFYEGVLGMPLISCVSADRVPSTGEEGNFLHTFFEMGDGSCVAFFDIEDLPEESVPSSAPRWAPHLALSVNSAEELESARRHLLQHGIDVTGPVDHEGIWNSIYFFDPNGVRLEITFQSRHPAENRDEVGKAVNEWLADHGRSRVS
jgi:glyoxylase I family protein